MEEGQPTLSTSAETIRNLPALQIPAQSSSASRRSHSHSHSRSRSRPRGSSRSHPHSPSSPHSPWSPSSPSGESVSSLPSVGSSFLFSSVPASPPHYPSHYPGRHEGEFSHNDFGEGDRSLIIPSLTLPSPLRPPTTHGHALGRIRLLVVNSSAAESSKVVDEVVSLLSDHNYPELVHVGQWDDLTLDDSEEVVAQTIRMSTDWIEHREAHGEDRYEPSSNIELVHLREYDSQEQPDVTLNTALSIIQASFHAISRTYGINNSEELLTASTSTLLPLPSQHHLSSALISSLLNPPSSGDNLLLTAVIVVPSAPPSPADDSLIVELRKYAPVIVLTTPEEPQEEEDTPKPDSYVPPPSGYTSLHLLNARPALSPADVRAMLYQNTHALSSLRKEAAELFLLWAGLSPQSIAEALELSLSDKPSDSSPRPFDPRDSDDVREQVQGREPDDRLDGTVKARTSTQYPYQSHQSDRESPKTRRGSMTKAARDRNGWTAGSGTLRGRPRGQTMERRKTITAATHPRPVVGPLARLDSLVQSQSSSQPSSASVPPMQSRRRRYAAEHGLSTGSTTVPNTQSPGYGHPLPPPSFSTFDPLHIPSLIRLAVEGLLLGPLRLRLSRLFGVAGGPVQDMAGEKGVEDLCTSDSDVKTRSRVSSFVPIALIAGAFCAGVGVGIVFTRPGI